MADHDGAIRWYTANPRGVLPLNRFHVSQTLRQLVRQGKFEIRIDFDFRQIMRSCAAARNDGTWINDELIEAYGRLHELGFAHSVEAWQDGDLAGGLYGVRLGGAFFGESRFHRRTNASKVALVHLVDRLHSRGYELLDTQATTEHLKQFGCIDVPAKQYLEMLRKAVEKKCEFVE